MILFKQYEMSGKVILKKRKTDSTVNLWGTLLLE
jgi:hypothetical protein